MCTHVYFIHALSNNFCVWIGNHLTNINNSCKILNMRCHLLIGKFKDSAAVHASVHTSMYVCLHVKWVMSLFLLMNVICMYFISLDLVLATYHLDPLCYLVVSITKNSLNGCLFSDVIKNRDTLLYNHLPAKSASHNREKSLADAKALVEELCENVSTLCATSD